MAVKYDLGNRQFRLDSLIDSLQKMIRDLADHKKREYYPFCYIMQPISVQNDSEVDQQSTEKQDISHKKQD